MDISLLSKYNISVPRYTSYPTVPMWQSQKPTEEEWIAHVKNKFDDSREISLYIHLPFCESLCTYCGCNKRITKNHGVEDPYIDALLKEWDMYLTYFEEKPILKEIHLGGGTPTFFDASKLQRLLSHIIDSSEVSSDHEFSFEAHPQNTTSQHLKTLFDLGFRRISIGVQDVSPQILKAINRHQSKDDVRNLTRWARAVGYTSVNYDIIYGLPFQKPMNVWDTLQFISETRPDRLAFYSYAHVPWKSPSQRAFDINDVPQGAEKLELYELGSYLLNMEGYERIGMDHFCLPDENLYTAYSQGKMHRNFMGYSTSDTSLCIAIGASSISDSWGAYIQNEKHIETYQERVSEGRLPIAKGHILSDDEKWIRSIILDLMCREKLDLNEVGKRKVIEQLLPNLDGMAKDGMVTYNNDYIRVLPKGRAFIRNICAAIDPSFQATTETGPKYSKAI